MRENRKRNSISLNFHGHFVLRHINSPKSALPKTGLWKWTKLHYTCWFFIILLILYHLVNLQRVTLGFWNRVCHISYNFFPLGCLCLIGKTDVYMQFQKSSNMPGEEYTVTQCVGYTLNCKNYEGTGPNATTYFSITRFIWDSILFSKRRV